MVFLTPFRERKAGITLVPSGVSKKVLGSLNEAFEVSTLNFFKATTKEDSKLLILENSCFTVAKTDNNVSSDVLR